MEIKLGFLSAFISVPLAYLFGEWHPMIGFLMVLIVLDVITGIAKGFYNKALRSRNMSQGMVRKAMIFVVLIIANLLDVSLFEGAPTCKMGVLCFYCGMEGLSVLENLGQMNVPLPAFIKNYLMVLQEKGESIKK